MAGTGETGLDPATAGSAVAGSGHGVTGLLGYLVLFGVLFVTPLHLESEYFLPPAQAGLLLTVLPLASGATAAVLSFLGRRARPKALPGPKSSPKPA